MIRTQRDSIWVDPFGMSTLNTSRATPLDAWSCQALGSEMQRLEYVSAIEVDKLTEELKWRRNVHNITGEVDRLKAELRDCRQLKEADNVAGKKVESELHAARSRIRLMREALLCAREYVDGALLHLESIPGCEVQAQRATHFIKQAEKWVLQGLHESNGQKV